jgi:hypothetical protein
VLAKLRLSAWTLTKKPRESQTVTGNSQSDTGFPDRRGSHRSREFDFLIACAQPDADVARLRALAPNVDWPQLAALAGYHRVWPLLYRVALDQGLVPETLRETWEADFRGNAVRNLSLMRDLIGVSRALSAAGVAVAPHKGPLLAMAAYGDLALRGFADLDMLVPPQALAQTLAVLDACGYRPDPALAGLSPGALARWTGEMSCSSAAGVSIDLHWRLTPPHYPMQLDPQILWRHMSVLKVAGVPVPTLEPEALLLVLAVHGAKHCWEALGWLADLAWLVSAHPGFDWDLTLALADEARCGRPFRLAAALIDEVFATALPDPVTQAIAADPRVARLKDRVLARWRSGPLEPPRSPELLSFAAALSTSRAATLRHVMGLILAPTELDWRARRLPESLFFLYGPRRVLRLLAKYIFRVPRRSPAHALS